MPQRRNPFGYGDSASGGAGASASTAMPMTGAGGSGQAYPTDVEQAQADAMGESPATVRRRIMPVAGPIRQQPNPLAIAQMLMQQKQSQGGGY